MTLSGALAAGTVATLVLFGSGWQGGAVLAAFFVSSNLISRVTKAPEGLDPKGDRRDHLQVFANGGAAALGALLGRSDPPLGVWLVTTAFAAAAADTWATSTGALSRLPPRLITSGQRVPRGTSGAMSLIGSAGAAVGALLVAATGALAGRMPILLPVATLIGFAGMVLDSAMGAALQGRFHCPVCDQPSEWRVHRCGAATVQRGGQAWLDNDGVNFAATAAAAGLAYATWSWLCPCS